jgi:hypothetical protein
MTKATKDNKRITQPKARRKGHNQSHKKIGVKKPNQSHKNNNRRTQPRSRKIIIITHDQDHEEC